MTQLLFKNFEMRRGQTVEFRVEGYNAFNFTQYQGVNTAAQFDFVTGNLTNPAAFGRINGVRANSNRVVQLGVRFKF